MRNERLEPLEGWRINTLRHCYERGSEDKPIRVYLCDGEFVASVFDCWIEGVWTTFDEAAAAAAEAAGEDAGAAAEHNQQ